jgi:Peptidase family M48
MYRKCNLLIISTILLLFYNDTICQSSIIYQPATTNYSYFPDNILIVRKRLDRDLKEIPNMMRKGIGKEYDIRARDLIQKLEAKEFMSDSIWLGFFNGILNEIYKGNPGIPRYEINMLIGRYEPANAFSIGEGSIVFHLGLLPYLSSESEIAAILCHELAHYQANHSNNFIKEYYDFLYSEEIQGRLKKISRSGYNKTARVMEIMKNMMYDNSRHGRYKELEADSLGLIYLKNTRYDSYSCLTALEKLDKIDSVTWPLIPYKTLFDAPQFPFNDAWLASSKSSVLLAQGSIIDDKWDTDSLKTHPDCINRIAAIKRQMGQPTTGRLNLLEGSPFEVFKQNSSYELVEGLMDANEYGRSLFRALVMLKEKPDDIYLKSAVGIALYQIYKHQKDHNLRYILSLPDPDFTEEYNRYLQFFNNLRLRDLSKMGYYYCFNQLEPYKTEEYPMLALALSQKMINQEEAFQQQKNIFLETFPKSKLIFYLK